MSSSEPTPPPSMPPPPPKPKRDPWEERERQRERWNNPRRRSSSSRSSSTAYREEPAGPDEVGFRNNYHVVGLLVAVCLLLLAELPQFGGKARTLLAQGGTITILLLLGTTRGFLDDMRLALRRGPNPWILALVGWSVFAFFTAPYREFALGELLRVASGAGAFLLAAYTLRSPRQVSYVLAGLLFLGMAISLYDLSKIGQRPGGVQDHIHTLYSIFGTHENVGSLLVLLVPLALAFALHPDIEEKRRLASTAATLILGGALLMARTRAAWLGGFVALGVLSVLFVLYGPKTEARRGENVFQRVIGSPVLLITLGFFIVVSVGGVAPLLSKRLGSIAGALEDSSFTDRLHKWNGGARMALEKPLTGWGLGSFPVLQGQWTHQGDELVKVLKQGTGHENIAHNYYVQWGAETGAVGVFLYVGAVAALLLALWRGLKATANPFQTVLLCGVVATVAGSLVDALGSPAYNFHGVSTVLWVIMGLGVAALRVPTKGNAASSPALGPTPLSAWLLAAASGLLVGGGLVFWGGQVVAQGRTRERGTLQLIATPVGPIRPGTSVSWRAVYTDEKGKEVSTMPGTLWRLEGEATVVNRAQAELEDDFKKWPDLHNAVFRVLVPPGVAPNSALTVRAFYRDRYGRRYEAASVKAVAGR